MAAITRIEVANFLCDGYEPGKEWMPLYRGETFRLAGVNGFGSSTAFQIGNGEGKTSLTEACLLLLTRNRQMKARVAARVAPPEISWTHIRIEFAERPAADEPAQHDLIVIDQRDVPGVPYVIGMVSARSKEPLYYRYQGVLEDAPCFQKDGTNLTLIDNETFKASVKRMHGAKWDTWRSAKEWEQEIKFFCDTEVLKQNVQFQIDGAGDYSAVFNKVNNRNGDGYDVNFFRQIIAPELLRDPLGNEGGEGEERFENALLNHLRGAVDRLLDISADQRELDAAITALSKFEPIEQKAQEVIVADQNYKQELTSLAGDAAAVVALARRKIPGLPNLEAAQSYASNKRLMKALSGLVISQREGVLITDNGLAELCGVETFRLNEYARERGIDHWSAIAQPIDLAGDLKETSPHKLINASGDATSQQVDYKGDLKENRRGTHRKHGAIYYDLKGALKAATAVSNLSGAHTEGLDDILTRAFGIAIDEIDTNPYRHEQERVRKALDAARESLAAATTAEAHWSAQYDTLLRERTEAQENQTAYETFRARAVAGEFLQEHMTDPLAAQGWAEDQLAKARQALEGHHKKVADLTAQYKNWSSLNERHMGAALQGVLDGLVASFKDATKSRDDANLALGQARTSRGTLDDTRKAKDVELSTLVSKCDRLEDLAKTIPAFIKLFGDTDAEALDPAGDLKLANRALLEATTRLQTANTTKSAFDVLKPAVGIFRGVFGDANPTDLHPTNDLQKHDEKLRIEGEILTEQQPLVEALELFREANPSKLPSEWIDDADKERQALGVERQQNELRTEEIKRELEELASVAMADDRVYAKAIAALEASRIPFERLHALIGATAGARQEHLLTLFSSALSAPVVETLEDADKATAVLEQAKLTVPVFLRAPLMEFAEHGEYKLAGSLAYSFLVGRRTRQVEILLNPSLIAEERERLTEESRGLEVRLVEIISRRCKLLPAGQLVQLAVNAKKAIEQHSKEKYDEATKRQGELSAQRGALLQRAALDAVASIGAMKDYAARGGDDSYNTLVALTIPQLTSAMNTQEKAVARLDSLNTPDATRCLLDAKEYKKKGGDKVLGEVRASIEALVPAIAELADQIRTLDGEITVLGSDLESAAGRIELLNKTYEVEKRDLESATAFQATDGLGYMQQAEECSRTLNNSISTYGGCLKGIDFERAARFARSGNDDARTLADRLAEAEGKREGSVADKAHFTEAQTQHQGRLSAITPFAEDLHGLAAAIHAQYAKIASFSDDIRRRMSEVPLDPEIMGYAQAIEQACLGDQASTNNIAKAAIGNLTIAIDQLEIDTRPLAMRASEKTRAFDAFQSKRAEFCEKARTGEIKGLQLPEIARIAEARTIEQLMAIHHVKDTIEASIRERHKQLEVLQGVMEEHKAATIDNMTRFARQAETNLAILERVMQKSPNARFYVHADIADSIKVRAIIDSLIATIQEREATARGSGSVPLNEDIEQRNREYIDQIHTQVYQKIFSNPSIHFSHKAIRGGNKTRLTGEEGGLSGGQRTALMMMWLIKQADYALTRSVVNSSLSRRDQKSALRAAQRIMFFDGLFSNLSNDEIISHAFQGLSDVDQNFQLIGLIHNPNYINNKDIFPVYIVGKKFGAIKDGKRHFVMAFNQYENKLGFFQSAYRANATPGGQVNA